MCSWSEIAFSRLVVATGLVLTLACGGGGGDSGSSAPSVSDFVPSSGHTGAQVAIQGQALAGAPTVAFGGVAGTVLDASSATLIMAQVPTNAVTGPVSVSASWGTGTSQSSFRVVPTVSSFAPTHGGVGAVITLNGTGLMDATSVTFGGGTSYQVTHVSGSQLQVVVPANASSGTVTVNSPGGNAQATGTFTLDLSISAFYPTQGPIGAKVILKGSGFTSSTTVAFNGTPVISKSFVNSGEIDAFVPSGAASGAISVSNGSPVSSSQSFTVNGSSTSLDLFVDGWYLTQSTQDYAGSVPLVANRDGLLRVFVRANMSNIATPTVTVFLNGASIGSIPVPAGVTSSTGVPTTINEGDTTKSWDLAIPGASITPGLSVTLQINPAPTAECDVSDNTVTGSPTVQTAKVFRVTVVPVVQGGHTGNVDSGRTLASWADRFQRMYPVENFASGIDIVKGSTFTYSGTLLADGTNWNDLLEQLDLKRLAEASNRYYYGAVNVGYNSGVIGMGFVGYPAAIGWDKDGLSSDGANYPEVFAHEVGHNLGREHSPCGVSGSSVDPSYPYGGGSIGVWGWDHAPGSSVAPLNTTAYRDPSIYKDIMGYCSPDWISDYTYRGTMAFRAASAMGDVTSAAQDCLLVSGTIQGSQAVLDPAFQVTTVPRIPLPGSYTLQLYDAQGRSLQQVSFEPVPIADLPAGSPEPFTFAIPLGQGVKAALRGLGVDRGGAMMARRGPSVPMAARIAVRPPVAARMQPGQVHLGWDPVVFPRVMVRDPRTGEVLSFAEGGAVDLETDAPEIEATFSDGVNSTTQRLTVP